MGRGMIVYEIDGEKLRDQVAEKGFSLVEASQEMGFNPYYISGCARHGKISSFGMKALTSLTGITLDEIKRVEPKGNYGLYNDPETESAFEQVKPDNGFEEFLEHHKVIIEIDYKKLNEAVYAAVYGAIKKASIDGWLG